MDFLDFFSSVAPPGSSCERFMKIAAVKERPQFVDTYGCECGTCCTIRKFAAASE